MGECARANRLEEELQSARDAQRNAEIGLVEVSSQNEQLQAENDLIGRKIERLRTEIFGWCKNCGALVIGRQGHRCDYCNGETEEFIVETELLRLRKIEQALKDK